MKKTTSGVDVKENLRIYLIEKLISFNTMRQGPADINNEMSTCTGSITD